MYEILILIIIVLLYLLYSNNIKLKDLKKEINSILSTHELVIKTFQEQQIKNNIQKVTIENKFNEQHQFLSQLKDEYKELILKNNTLRVTKEADIKEAIKEARADSVKRQRSILKGQATEHLAPYINNKYNPKDYRFFGDPIDYIIFDGMHNFKETKEIKKIIFMDIKTGKSSLTTLQRRIRDAILENKVEFQVYKPEKPEEGL